MSNATNVIISFWLPTEMLSLIIMQKFLSEKLLFESKYVAWLFISIQLDISLWDRNFPSIISLKRSFIILRSFYHREKLAVYIGVFIVTSMTVCPENLCFLTGLATIVLLSIRFSPHGFLFSPYCSFYSFSLENVFFTSSTFSNI